MNVKHLSYFVCVAKHNSISKAAKELFISQSAVSQAIKELEDSLNTTLFIRNNNTITLTKNGEFLFKKAKPIINSIKELEEDMDNLTSNSNDISLGIPPMLGTFLFPSILTTFANKNPGVKFVTKEYGSNANRKAILNGELNIAFTVIYNNEIDSNLNYISLGKTNLLLYVDKNHYLAKKKSINLNDVKNLPLILMKEDSLQYQLINSKFEENNIKPNIVLTSNQLYTIKEILLNGKIGAFIFDKVLKKQDELIGIPFEDNIQLDIVLIWKKDIQLSKQTKKFISFVQHNMDIE